MTYTMCQICQTEQYCFPQFSTEPDQLINTAVCPDCLSKLYNSNLNRY
ncbi:hypothetical protein SDC9_04275 [bioreactor metagenome]|uniref:Uncharacterized protein n=1 Tax=bioreactor metagenome TaxID=1076179 RepID=A0A644SVU5_9ZZZZ